MTFTYSVIDSKKVYFTKYPYILRRWAVFSDLVGQDKLVFRFKYVRVFGSDEGGRMQVTAAECDLVYRYQVGGFNLQNCGGPWFN